MEVKTAGDSGASVENRADSGGLCGDSAGVTPGPWVYGVREDGSMWLSLGDPKSGPHYQGDLVSSPQDARLIAAAPELLYALKRVDRNWTHGGFAGPEDPRALARFSERTISTWRDIRAAIRKAEKL